MLKIESQGLYNSIKFKAFLACDHILYLSLINGKCHGSIIYDGHMFNTDTLKRAIRYILFVEITYNRTTI
jgi:hypothetical protein